MSDKNKSARVYYADLWSKRDEINHYMKVGEVRGQAQLFDIKVQKLRGNQGQVLTLDKKTRIKGKGKRLKDKVKR